MVAVVNEAFAKRGSFGDAESWLGQHLALVAWVPKNATSRSLGFAQYTLWKTSRGKVEPTVSICRSHRAALGTRAGNGCSLSCGLAGNPLNYVHAVRDLVQRADQRLPLSDVKSQSVDQPPNQPGDHVCPAYALRLRSPRAGDCLCGPLPGAMSYRVGGAVDGRHSASGWRLGAQRSRVVWKWSFARWFYWRQSYWRSVCQQCLDGGKTGGIVSLRGNETEQIRGL